MAAMIREAYLENERKRFTRSDSHRDWRPDAYRWMTAEERRLFRPPLPQRTV